MADERLRDLERKAAGGDAAAKAAYLRALVRTGDERVVEVRELEESLRSLLERTRSHVNEEIERDHGHDDGAVGRCPELKLKHLQATARMAVGGRHGAAFGYGYKVLAKVWPRPRREGLEQEDWDPTSQAHPYTVMAFAAHDGPWRVSIDVATSWSRKPTPGTTWPALQPWRTDVRAELMERKVRSWAKGIQLQASPATVRLWLDLAALEESSHPSAEPRIVDLDRPSEKQLNYIEALVRQKQLAEGEVTDLLRVHTGAKRIVHLHRREASAVIEALLEVPDPSPPAPRKKAGKVAWTGRIEWVQPRIKLSRLFDERQHGYPGYQLLVSGSIEETERRFWVGIGKAAQAKHAFRVGDRVSGAGVPVPDLGREVAELYKVSKLKLLERGAAEGHPPPWQEAPPGLEVYRERRHRRLAEEVYREVCVGCVWAARMPVDLLGAGRAVLERRFETFCYGPKACLLYEAGPQRERPSRGGGYELEPDAVDREETAHRGPNA